MGNVKTMGKIPNVTPSQISSAKRLFQEGLEQIPKIYRKLDEIDDAIEILAKSDITTGHLHQVLEAAYLAAERKLTRYFWN